MRSTWAGILASIFIDPNPQWNYDALPRPVGPYKWHSQLFESFFVSVSTSFQMHNAQNKGRPDEPWPLYWFTSRSFLGSVWVLGKPHWSRNFEIESSQQIQNRFSKDAPSAIHSSVPKRRQSQALDRMKSIVWIVLRFGLPTWYPK